MAASASGCCAPGTRAGILMAPALQLQTVLRLNVAAMRARPRAPHSLYHDVWPATCTARSTTLRIANSREDPLAAVLHRQGVAMYMSRERPRRRSMDFQVLAFGGSVATWLASAGVVANKRAPLRAGRARRRYAHRRRYRSARSTDPSVRTCPCSPSLCTTTSGRRRSSADAIIEVFRFAVAEWGRCASRAAAACGLARHA